MLTQTVVHNFVCSCTQKQILILFYFEQDDKDLVPEFVISEGLTCFIKVGAEADHNYQNYILRGCIQHHVFTETYAELLQNTSCMPKRLTLLARLLMVLSLIIMTWHDLMCVYLSEFLKAV